MEININNGSTKEEKPQIKPVTSNVKIKKESEFKKFRSLFFSSDISNVRKQLFSDVVIPGVQRVISELVKTGIDWFLYGIRGTNYQSQNGTRNVSYSEYYRRNQNGVSPSGQPSPRSSIFSVNDVVFNDRGEAEVVLQNLNDIVDRYEMASAADFYDLINVQHNYTDGKYGWRDLRNATIERVRDGYSIRFPKAVSLE